MPSFREFASRTPPDRVARLEGRADPAPALAELAWELGYADQAHLTRECRELSGLTPRELIDWWAA